MNIVSLQDIKLIHRNPLHSYTLTMKNQREIKKTISFTIVMKRMKYLGVYLPKDLKNGLNMPLTTRKPRGVHCFKL